MKKPGQTSLFEGTFGQDLPKAISPDDQITRYARTWRFSMPQEDDGFLVGKLGFVRQAAAMQRYYDELTHDFVEQAATAEDVQYAHWALNVDAQLLDFERRPREIEVQSFVGAFRALLDQHPEYRLTVEALAEPATFYEWRTGVQRLVRFRAVIRPPNPRWTERTDRIRELVDKPHAGEVTLDVKAPPEEGLQLDDTILEEVVDFQGEGYARIKAEGYAQAERKLYDSTRAVEVQRRSVVDPRNHHEVWTLLKELIRARLERQA